MQDPPDSQFHFQVRRATGHTAEDRSPEHGVDRGSRSSKGMAGGCRRNHSLATPSRHLEAATLVHYVPRHAVACGTSSNETALACALVGISEEGERELQAQVARNQQDVMISRPPLLEFGSLSLRGPWHLPLDSRALNGKLVGTRIPQQHGMGCIRFQTDIGKRHPLSTHPRAWPHLPAAILAPTFRTGCSRAYGPVLRSPTRTAASA